MSVSQPNLMLPEASLWLTCVSLFMVDVCQPLYGWRVSASLWLHLSAGTTSEEADAPSVLIRRVHVSPCVTKKSRLRSWAYSFQLHSSAKETTESTLLLSTEKYLFNWPGHLLEQLTMWIFKTLCAAWQSCSHLFMLCAGYWSVTKSILLLPFKKVQWQPWNGCC